MMQEALTFLYNAVLSVGGTYLGVSFILEMVDFWQRCEPKPVTKDQSTAMEVAAIRDPHRKPNVLPTAQTPEAFVASQPDPTQEAVATVADIEVIHPLEE